MTVLDNNVSHLTAGNKAAIKAILKAKLLQGRVGRTDYFLSKAGEVYTVKIVTNERSAPGMPLKPYSYSARFML